MVEGRILVWFLKGRGMIRATFSYCLLSFPPHPLKRLRLKHKGFYAVSLIPLIGAKQEGGLVLSYSLVVMKTVFWSALGSFTLLSKSTLP